MIDEINAEREKSDRLTVAKLNVVKQFNKQDLLLQGFLLQGFLFGHQRSDMIP